MLPKVAGQILHHTSRAVAVVQGQTGHAVRSVLQTGPTNLGQWNGPGSSSSGWNGSGPSSGGAKYSSSSRFHSSYAGAGRAVAHADASASYSDVLDTSDEGFEVVATKDNTISIRSKRRARSSSLSFTLQVQKEPEARSVLKAIKHYVRARHAFAVSQDAQTTDTTPSDLQEPALLEAAPSPLIRTATSDTPIAEASERDSEQQACAALLAASRMRDRAGVHRESEILRSTENPSAFVYNAILEALRVVRPHGGSLDDIMAVYNEMIARSIRPNLRTYGLLILSLTDRDREVLSAIQSTERRLEYRALIGAPPNAETEELEKYIEQLRSEQNFSAAMTLFKAAHSLGRKFFWGPRREGDLSVYISMLRSCVAHADVATAIDVFDHVEHALKESNRKPTIPLFIDMILVHVAANDMKGAEMVFQEYQQFAQAGRLVFDGHEGHAGGQYLHMMVWNNMVQGYIKCGQPNEGLKLLEQMMDSASDADFGPTDVPRPSPATFFGIVSGFLRSGDVASALIWFDKLLQQRDLPTSVLSPSGLPTKPETGLWSEMFAALASSGMADAYIKLAMKAVDEGVSVSSWDAVLAVKLSLDHFDAHPEIEGQDILQTLDFLLHNLNSRGDSYLWSSDGDGISSVLRERVVQTYLRLGNVEGALRLAELYVENGIKSLDSEGLAHKLGNAEFTQLRAGVQSLTPLFLSDDAEVAPTFYQAMRFAVLSDRVHLEPTPVLSHKYMRLYTEQRQDGTPLQLTPSEWTVLVKAVLCIERNGALDGQNVSSLEAFLTDVVSTGTVLLKILPSWLSRQFVVALVDTMGGADNAQSLVESAGGQIAWAMTSATRVRTPKTDVPHLSVDWPAVAPSPVVNIDRYHSRYIDERSSSFTSPGQILQAYRKFDTGLKDGVYPTLETMGRLINALGRQGEMDKVHTLYDASQTVLASLNHDKLRQSVGWFQIEDQMIIALAHGGETDAAHIHRTRILGNGGAPSADAYAALIQRVKDTTDDTANAMTLFQESRDHGVVANIFLYNTAISKLAKARKVDHALELFQEMKATGFRPTSVTYGAVIAACCRVGDAQSAEVLFQEMASQPNFKPRVPPFNTMMQLYTHTKPDRERVLFYAGALKRANVSYTAHTYKLLMDAYGTIEPLDLDAMERTFKDLEDNSHVHINGTHWAAMINAYGCASKDLDKAITVFESIANHPSSTSSKLPDAICFEAMLNVLVTMKRTDLIPQYLERMESRKIHMTAYIANLVIKGYSAAGYIEQAREVFEGLNDPPEGIAAPNNHAAYDSTPRRVSPDEPVYREPSTWEAMIRAELGNGDRERALTLLERLKARRFPPAVYGRISGIFSTDPAAIWDDGNGSPLSPQSLSLTSD